MNYIIRYDIENGQITGSEECGPLLGKTAETTAGTCYTSRQRTSRHVILSISASLRCRHFVTGNARYTLRPGHRQLRLLQRWGRARVIIDYSVNEKGSTKRSSNQTQTQICN